MSVSEGENDIPIFTPAPTESVASQEDELEVYRYTSGRKLCYSCGELVPFLEDGQPLTDDPHTICHPEDLLNRFPRNGFQSCADSTNVDKCDCFIEELEYVDLAPHGDLILWFSDLNWMVRVASKVLFSASPFFSRMQSRGGCWPDTLREARKWSECAVLSFTDNSIAFEHILGVLHHRQPPAEISYGNLTSIAEIAMTYEMATALRVHIINWMQPHLVTILKPGHEGYLTVAWVFHMEKEFANISEELGWRAMINPWNRIFSGASSTSVWKKLNGDYIEGIQLCELLQLGHATQSIVDLGLNDNSGWFKSPRNIFAALSELEPMIMPSIIVGEKRYAHHKCCSWVHHLSEGLDNGRNVDMRLKLKDYGR